MRIQNSDETVTTPESTPSMEKPQAQPVLLVAFTTVDEGAYVDRSKITDQLTIGRKSPSILHFNDGWLSKEHCRISHQEGGFFLEDCGSTNGTFVNGFPVIGKKSLGERALIRAGRSLFVFHADGGHLLESNPVDTFKMAGRFHVASLVRKLKGLADSYSHVLLAGPSGSGKELAAHAFACLAEKEIIIHNAARFGTEDEAASTLFGVSSGVFTGVTPRVGLIEQADKKILFLDEAHQLPLRLQKSLLRVVEDWRVSRIGETEGKRVDVRFILASNDPPPSYGLAHDFLARFRIVNVPSLSERMADIPSIFLYVLESALRNAGTDPKDTLQNISADHFESLCLDGFPNDNTRGLQTIAADIVDEIRGGKSSEKAIKSVFEQRYANGPVIMRNSERLHLSSRKKKKDDKEDSKIDIRLEATMKKANIDLATLNLIKEAYYECRGVVVDIVTYLKKNHEIRLSRARVSKIVDMMNLPRVKRTRSI